MSDNRGSGPRSSGKGRGGKGRGGQGRGGSGGGRGGQAKRGGGPDRTPEQLAAEKLSRSLDKILDRIPATQADVLRYRMGLVDGQPHSTADTARKLGLSLSETREIEKRAFEHIREAVPVEHLQRFLKA